MDEQAASAAEIERRAPTWAGMARPCTAHTTKGLPCRAPAIRGFVCVTHGGAAPQVKAAAAIREANWEQLHDAAPVAITRLRKEASEGENAAAAEDDVPGSGNGFVDIYDTDGNLVDHFAEENPSTRRGVLPWGHWASAARAVRC